MNTIISLNNLSLHFSNVTALSDVSLNVEQGAVFGFLGPNGAGKTTTIKVMLGLLKPTKGTSNVLGYNTISDSEKIRASSGVLLEHNGLYEMLSAEENLEYYARIWSIPTNERRARIKQLLTHIGLWDRRKEKVGNWSKGMKQKLAIIRCLIHRPKLIFLDEPTSGLDPVSTASLRNDLVGMVKNEGLSIFLTTHNLDEVEKMCTSAAIINKGQLLAMGTIDDLKNADSKGAIYKISCKPISQPVLSHLQLVNGFTVTHYSSTDITVALNAGETISALVQKMVEAGVEIIAVNKAERSLEEFYLSVMNTKYDKRN